jgi:hypothetical protein
VRLVKKAEEDEPLPEAWYPSFTAESGQMQRTRALLERLLDSNNSGEQRERTMLRWTIAGVVLAGIAAVAAIVTIFLSA